jgi:hypothetical protein
VSLSQAFLSSLQISSHPHRSQSPQKTSCKRNEDGTNDTAQLFASSSVCWPQSIQGWMMGVVKRTMGPRKKNSCGPKCLAIIKFPHWPRLCKVCQGLLTSPTFKSLQKNKGAFQGEVHSCLDSGRPRNL